MLPRQRNAVGRRLYPAGHRVARRTGGLDGSAEGEAPSSWAVSLARALRLLLSWVVGVRPNDSSRNSQTRQPARSLTRLLIPARSYSPASNASLFGVAAMRLIIHSMPACGGICCSPRRKV